MTDLERLDEAIAGVLGWHIDDVFLPAAVREEHNTVLVAARAYQDLLANGERVDDVVNGVIRKLYQTFQPPVDLSINEKVAWKEGLYFAAEFIAESVDAAIGDKLLSDYPKEAENDS